MANVAGAAPAPGQSQAQPPSRASTGNALGRLGALFAQTEIDLRLFGMLVALAAILIGFNFMSGGKLIAPGPMITMAVQATGIAILATGMVLIIVSRNIDLSVGSLVGIISMSYALLMSDWFPHVFGIAPGAPFQWALAIAIGVVIGALFGALQGYIVAYIGVPSFIVTLGGLFWIRGIVWFQSQGAAVSGIDPTFQLIGGGDLGSAGETLTWVIAVAGCLAVVAMLYAGRRQRRRYDFPVRPMWAEGLLVVIGSVACLGIAWFANHSFWPQGLVARYATEHGISPDGLQIADGLPFPVLILVGVTIVMAWLATRRRFGRYVYAFGGNPDAAELAGINTRRVVMQTFILMGILCALAAAVSTARLNGSTLDIGVGYELYVIAAAVIGGTSFSGGIGTIPGAVIGAFVMQALQYGLAFNNVNSAGQNIVLGIVLIVAVGLDTLNRKRGS